LFCKRAVDVEERYYCAGDTLPCKRAVTVQESCYCARELLMLKRDITVQESSCCAREPGCFRLFVKQFIQFSLIYLH